MVSQVAIIVLVIYVFVIALTSLLEEFVPSDNAFIGSAWTGSAFMAMCPMGEEKNPPPHEVGMTLEPSLPPNTPSNVKSNMDIKIIFVFN